MSISARVREQLLSSFRAELAEHVQTMTDGLLALEQGTVAASERQSTLETIFRAAHSLKGAARAVGVTVIEQLAHALESILDGLQHERIELTAELANSCYAALDAVQAVQAAYEAGETTPPLQAMQALVGLEPFLSPLRSSHQATPATAGAATPATTVAPPTPAPPIRPAAPAALPKPHDLAAAVEQHIEEEWQGLNEEVIPPVAPPFDGTAEALLPTPPPLAGASLLTPARNDETIRVSVKKLDALMGQLSELLVTKIRAEQRLSQMHQFQTALAQWQKEWLSVRSTYGRLTRHGVGDGGQAQLGKDTFRILDYVGANQERLREINTLVNDLSREYANDTMHMALVIDELEEEIKRVRMLPLSTITGPFARMVRDLAQNANKEAVLQIVGGDTELDKRVLEQIKDPLIHLLRNAVDHGLETPEQRQAAGKPRIGTITLTAEQMGKDVVIAVADDGAGLDTAAIRQVIARHSQIDVTTMTEAEVVEAIFKVGVSTSPIVTDISGRGVGLDVVRRNVEALHGRIDVDWKTGAGSTFTLILPLTLTGSRGLLVRAANQLFAIPLNNVERIEDVHANEITTLEGHDTVRYAGHPLTLVRLGDVLQLPRAAAQHANERIPVVILAAAERRLAFAVDELFGEQEVVIKSLGRQLSRIGGIAGATVMGSGQVVLILNVSDLIKMAMHGERRAVFEAALEEAALASDGRSQRHILIVDDSITTRTLEKNILEAAGYRVELATDGQEALNAIASNGLPDLVVSDVAMPRLDGFGLTQRIKTDPRTAHLPVILVTSLDSPEDKRRGIEAGADAYITKGAFDQNNLLDTIQQLI